MVTELKDKLNALNKSFESEFSLNLILGGSIVTIGLSFFLNISLLEWTYIIFFLSVMLGFELFNTALEDLVDIETDKYNILAKASKDVSSASEAIFAIISVLGIALILVPKIIEYITWW